MTETSRFWDGTTGGDATSAPYDAATEFAAVLLSISGSEFTQNYGGVFRGSAGFGVEAGQVTGASSPVAVGIMDAIVFGTWYTNTAPLNIAVPSSGSTRHDLIVLRKDWAAKTVRVTRIAGVDGGGVPAMVHNPGVTWDVPLAQLDVVGGAITVVDLREKIPFFGAVGVSGKLGLNYVPVTTVPATIANGLAFNASGNLTISGIPTSAVAVHLRFDFGVNTGGTAGAADLASLTDLGATHVYIENVLAPGGLLSVIGVTVPIAAGSGPHIHYIVAGTSGKTYGITLTVLGYFEPY